MTVAACLDTAANYDEWRNIAKAMLVDNVPPKEVDWNYQARDSGSLLDTLPTTRSHSAVKVITVPKEFVPLAEKVICHSNPQRFDLLYRLLWRLQSEKKLLEILSDEDVVLAHKMEKSVRRDSHKMKAFVRFKEIPEPDQLSGARRKFWAWFEPDHFIVERVAPFFQRRFTDMDWIIATPKGSAVWDGTALTMSRDPAVKLDTDDATDDLWRTYFANIFNPARLKIKAMQAEMPKKYWKNLPEADLIPDLINTAEARVQAMRERQATMPPVFHERLQAVVKTEKDKPPEAAGSLADLKHQAEQCTRCDLYKNATQTVFGDGPENADIMFVGEQPGDQEDLAGLPFVGPAGKVFDMALDLAGIDRTKVYVTNAVKHFKYIPRGKRRIHQKPNMGEVRACRWWLKKEIEFIKPKLIVALGATALTSLTEKQQRLSDFRGKEFPFGAGQKLFVTVHPSYLLRIPEEDMKHVETEKFINDIRLVKKLAIAS
ncbi:UdgX family uracil-DNA binding protein [Phyllobacterium sp. YR531]|uniref:UdgX family uracil-DNA binding protein n=1 Tax=Phyllobacterium sp. YR531 TaxID=1144343 RepID=UPI00026FAA4A|nr:UdgX family uracil-DNA binding protein [Phyllobacterium sp. YR531]EJM99329.1 uracil-DNA glycosylase, family 4 [Phyllobacterium sp. YR531]